MPDFHPQGSFCASCGNCCKSQPGSAFPTDFVDMEKEIYARLKTGHWVLDWWEGDIVKPATLDCVYYLRPAYAKHDRQHVFHPGWGGACVFLTATGCQFPYKERPGECRALKPKETADGQCVGNKEDMVLQWRPYQELLERLGDQVEREGHDNPPSS